ncbi:5'-nucleotidase C-terminal domain-containing protein [Changpingibacter yushuensis]|uniref:5'-nucleotidase C-terminal domain-containing protein n=1 Tax=Changpingibacter yushuensis TaxID=2758440 RepID=UPI00165E9537|nr:5'-nucleotidase C-terminal domain-containing protein [Changpingibacter yushuensis]
MSDAPRRAGRSVGAVAVFAVAATGLTALPANAEPDSTVTIDIAAISDFHGHIENASTLATYVNQMKDANPDTIFAANGDLVGGSAFVSSIQQDQPTIDILNAMGLEVSSTGNHEYDRGYSDLLGRIGPAAQWPYIVSNVSGVDTTEFAPTYTVTTPSGVDVAFVGAVTDELPTLVSPAGIAGLTVTDPVAAVNAQAALLKDGNDANGEADVVIALIHETTSVAKNVGSNVDAVVAGHTHQDDSAATASGAPVIEPGSYGQYAGHISVSYDTTAGAVTNATAEVDTLGNLGLAKDADIEAMYQQAKSVSDGLGSGTAGTIVGGADRGTNDGTKASLGTNRGTEMTAGNMIAQAFYEYSQSMSKTADFGIMNPGGVRADIDADGNGTVTLGESYTAQPFGNSYGIVDLTAAQVYTLLEQQWADASTQTSRPILQLGISDSLSYTYTADASFGHHIKQVFLDGAVLDRNDTTTLYTVASNAFLLAGGDGFTVFKAGVNYQDTGIIDNDVFNEFLAANPGYVVDYAQRNIAITGEDTLVAGEGTTISLASLSMTYATALQPLPRTVTIALDGETIGRAGVNNTVTPNLNETGKATVSVVVPDDVLGGEHALTIIAGPTEITIPVQVEGLTLATPEAPSFSGNVVTIPSVEGVVYTVDGEEVTGSIELTAENPTVTVEAYAADGYVLDGDSASEWSFAYDNGVSPIADTSKGRNVFFSTDFVHGVVDFAMTVSGADQILSGDWNSDGIDTIAIRKGRTYTFFDSNRTGAGSYSVVYGGAGSTPVVGDFNGDGFDDLAVRSAGTNTFNIKYSVSGRISGGQADRSFGYGRASDAILAGDWNGDGSATIGVQRGNRFLLKNTLAGGVADVSFVYGRSSDVAVTGDFDGDGTDTVSVVRGARVYVNNALAGGSAETLFTFGRATDQRVAGDWFGTGTDTIAVYRR